MHTWNKVSGRANGEVPGKESSAGSLNTRQANIDKNLVNPNIFVLKRLCHAILASF